MCICMYVHLLRLCSVYVGMYVCVYVCMCIFCDCVVAMSARECMYVCAHQYVYGPPLVLFVGFYDDVAMYIYMFVCVCIHAFICVRVCVFQI